MKLILKKTKSHFSVQTVLIINVFVIWAGLVQIAVLTAVATAIPNAMPKLGNVISARKIQVADSANSVPRAVLAMQQAELGVRNAFVMGMKMYLLAFVIRRLVSVFARIIRKDFIVINVLKVSFFCLLSLNVNSVCKNQFIYRLTSLPPFL